MTEKQQQRIKDKIKAIRKVLADERRRFGGYDDSRGRRYMPPALYLQIQDYSGAMTYFRWFAKNFPDDIGLPEVLFVWTVALFKTKKLKEAELKATQTFFSNTYVLDKFLGLAIEPIEKDEFISLARPEYAEYFSYSHEQKDLQDFADWLSGFLSSDKFKAIAHEFIRLQQLLLHESPGPVRDQLLKQVRELQAGVASQLSTKQ